MPIAATFGHVARHARTANDTAGRVGTSSASSPASSDASRASAKVGSASVAMACHLAAQLLGHLGRERRDAAVLDATGARQRDVEVCRETSGPAGEQHDAIAEPRGLTHVVGDE